MTIVTTLGVESLVNTSTFGDQAQARGTALANGQYVVVWVDYLIAGQLTDANTANADIKARLFNADGTPADAEFLVNTTTAGGQIFCNAVTLSDGHFLVTWNNGAGTVLGGSGASIATARAQEFTAAGAPVGGEFAIGAPGVEILGVASSPLAGGGFVATWQQGGSGGAIVAQIYDSNNVAVGGQIVVDNTDLRSATFNAVRTLANGNFVIAWNNNFGAIPITNMQIYSPSGLPVGSPITAGINGINGGGIASLVALANGGFALGMIEVTAPTAFLKIYAYDVNGGLLGTTDVTQQPIGQNGQNPLSLSLSALANGGVAATWVDNNTTDGSGTSVHLTVYGPSGNQIDNSVIVNTNTGGNQITPTMLTLSNGDFVTLWSDASGTLGDSSGTSIKQQIFDVSTVNRAPVAVNDSLILANNSEVIPANFLTENDTDADGDILVVTSITNIAGGSVSLNVATQELTATRPQGSSAPIEFDYTITDGQGGTSTAHVILLAQRTDYVTVRGNSSLIDFLANDYLQPRADGYAYAASVVSGNGGPVAPAIVTTPTGPQIFFSPLNVPGYLTLPVGQTISVLMTYTVSNPVTGATDYSESVSLTLEGWTQTGGTLRDALTGTALADHLIGGSGAANELVGGAGDDFYTTSAVGDTIFERPNEGLDTVRAQGLSSFVLPDNVENLQAVSATAGFVGIGNALNNFIVGTSFADSLAGGAGDDRLQGLSGAANELIGGTGNDTYIVAVAGDTIIELANEGTDTVQTSLAAYALNAANLENLTYTGSGSFQGVGNSADNVITGGVSAASTLVGLDGNDTYVVRNAGDSIVEAAAGGTDTVQTSLSFYRLNAANVENLTYTGTGNFTGIGNAENNVITGGAGADYLYAGAGTDTLVGGAGADVFLFDQAVSGVDAISDFTSGSDRLFFNQTVFTHTPVFALVQGAGAQVAATANSSFLYNSTTGALSFDADGNGAGAAIAVANLAPGLTLTQADFVFYG